MNKLSSKHQKTLQKIFTLPPLANIEWRHVEALLINLGAHIEEGSGSRIHVLLNNEASTFHRPHPQKETDKGAVGSVRRFLINAGITPTPTDE